ncbi:MAG: hypothetical protein ACYCZ7_01265 [Minisyncoccota bacterium]
MADSTDSSDIIIESSHELDEGTHEQQSDKNADALRQTLDQEGIFVEPIKEDAGEEESAEGFPKRLLDQSDIEIIPGKNTEEDSY